MYHVFALFAAALLALGGVFSLAPRTPTVPAAHKASQVLAATSTESIRVPIFIYHSVEPDFVGETAQQKTFSVTPEELEAQLKYLSDQGYTTISLDELAREVSAGTTSPVSKPVVLTFDDGWQNEYTYAFPLLQKYHQIATFFIFTNPIGKDARFMTWGEVLALDKAGMTIGDHTVTHPYLSKLTPEDVRHEVLDGKKTLEAHLGKPVVHFASPFGYTSDGLVALLHEAGFVTGRTTDKGMRHSPGDLLRLTGYLVHRDLKDFQWALEHAR